MLVLIALLLALVPAIAVLYPVLRGLGSSDPVEDEGTPQAELARRWDAALAGLRNTELEHAVGNLSEEDYGWLREQYMTEAAVVMKAFELEESQQRALMSRIEHEVQRTRAQSLGVEGNGPETARGPEKAAGG